jgi:hypothetical protein
MSIPTAAELLEIFRKEDKLPAFALGSVDEDYVSGKPKILFDGETVVSTKTYPYLETYTPTAADRVLLARVGGSYVVLGKVVN